MGFATGKESDVEDNLYFCLPDPVCNKCHKSCEIFICFPNACFHMFCYACHSTLNQGSENKWILVCPICAKIRQNLTLCRKHPLDHQWNNFQVKPTSWQRSVSEFRKMIYEQKVLVQDFAISLESFREFTPEFYRNHGLQIYRLVPWLKREVYVLLDYSDKCGKVVDEIISMLSTHFIRSQEFKVAVGSYFGDKTDHFIHEFYMFACSFCDLYGYDEYAYYFLNVDGDEDNDCMAKIDNREDNNTTQIEAIKMNYYMYLQKTFSFKSEKFKSQMLKKSLELRNRIKQVEK